MAQSGATPNAKRSIRQIKNRMVDQVMETSRRANARQALFHSALKIAVMVAGFFKTW
jgi:hypothetical protein